MAKKPKNKKKPRSGQGQGGPFGAMRDLTAERFFSSQTAKADRLLENEEYDEALQILIPLSQKYPNRAEAFEALGTAYVGIEFFAGARDAFEQALHLSPVNRVDPLLRFNLAHMYILTGLPLLSFDQIEQIDWNSLGREMDGLDTTTLSAFRELSTAAVTEMAENNNLGVAEFLKQFMPLERGQLALQKNNPQQARQFFGEAIELNPDSIVAHNSLALAALLEDDYAGATEQARYILDKLDSHNLDALATLIRISQEQDKPDEARNILAQIKALPVPEEIEGLIQQADIYALFEDDQAVYDLIKPIFDDPPDWEDVEESTVQEVLILAGVSAVHLGRPDEALEMFDSVELESEGLLLGRTHEALEEGEEGPRLGGRFFYNPPNFTYPAAFEAYQTFLHSTLAEGPKEQDFANFRPFFEKYGRAALDIILFQTWTIDEPLMTSALIMEALGSGIEGATELVERLTFSRVGSPVTHILSAAALIEHGVLPADQPVTIWVGDEQRTGTLDELTKTLRPPS